jgi:hypothetical protein
MLRTPNNEAQANYFVALRIASMIRWRASGDILRLVMSIAASVVRREASLISSTCFRNRRQYLQQMKCMRTAERCGHVNCSSSACEINRSDSSQCNVKIRYMAFKKCINGNSIEDKPFIL